MRDGSKIFVRREPAGADDRIRTDDLRITNALLYQLSYVGSACNG